MATALGLVKDGLSFRAELFAALSGQLPTDDWDIIRTRVRGMLMYRVFAMIETVAVAAALDEANDLLPSN